MKYNTASKHFIPGTDVLQNKFGLRDQGDLSKKEQIITVVKLKDVPDGDFSLEHLQAIHKHLFGDIYSWAGELRDVPVSKGNSLFARPQFIDQELRKVTSSVDPEALKGLGRKEFSGEITHLISELNAVHPFLEGNGRTIRAYARKLCEAAGYHLSIERIRSTFWNKASIQAFNGDTEPLRKIVFAGLSQGRHRGSELSR